jgi:hypothetical protein
MEERSKKGSDGGWSGWLMSAFGDESAMWFNVAADPHLVAVAASHGATLWPQFPDLSRTFNIEGTMTT